ncbi:MAG: hypothetical protein WC655_12775 [Candidatus Hydrogenedentales bacterium]
MIACLPNRWQAHPLPFVALIRRELIRSLRSQYLSGAMLFASGTGIVGLLFLWPDSEAPLVAMARVSHGIIALFGVLSAATACILLPGFAGGAIVEERSNDSFDLLRMTLIRPIGVLAGKFVNCLGAFLLLMAAVMPLFATSYFLVGVDWSTLPLIAFSVAISAVTCVSIGLACSAAHRAPMKAMISSYVWCAFALGGYMLIVLVGLFVVSALFGEIYFNRVAEPVMMTVFKTTPLCILAASLGTPISANIPRVLLIQAGISTFALLVAWRKLCRPPREIALPHSAPSPKGKKRTRLPVGYSKRPHKPIADNRNPVFIREARHTGLLKGIRIVKLYIVPSLIAAPLWADLYIWGAFSLHPSELDYTVLQFVFLFFALILLIAPTVVATAFVREDEQNTKDLLRMTVLAPREVALGKICAAAISLGRLCLPLVIAAWPLLILVARCSGGWIIVLDALTWALPCIIAIFSLAAIASMAASRTVLAVPLSYGLCAAYFFLPASLFLTISQTRFISLPASLAEKYAVLLSPVLYAVDVDNLASSRYGNEGWLWIPALHLTASLLLFYLAVKVYADYWIRRTLRLHL